MNEAPSSPPADAPAHDRSAINRLLLFFAIVYVVEGLGQVGGLIAQPLSYYLKQEHGWTPSQVSTMVLTGGGLGFWGWILFGRAADIVGRRPTAIVCLVGAAAAVSLFYRTRYLFPAFAAIVFFESGITIAMSALSTENFPTALRATARAWVTTAGVLGAMLGLALVGMLSDRLGGHAGVVAVLGLVPLALAPLVLLVPETVG